MEIDRGYSGKHTPASENSYRGAGVDGTSQIESLSVLFRNDDEFIPPGAKHLRGTALLLQKVYLHPGGVERNETLCSFSLITESPSNSVYCL